MKSLAYIRDVGLKGSEKKGMKLHAYIYRQLSIYITFFFQFLPLTPNMVSLLAIIVTLAAGLFFLSPNPRLFLAGVGLLYLGETLDYVDGTLARTINKTSKFIWIFLDVLFHEIPRQFVFFFIGVGGYMATSRILYLYLGIACLVSQLLVMYLSQLRKALVSNYLGIKFVSEDPNFESEDPKLKQSNPFLGQGRKWMMQAVVFPMRQNKLILLFLSILSFWMPHAVFDSLLFFGPFLSLRSLVFFASTYRGMMGLERQAGSKSK